VEVTVIVGTFGEPKWAALARERAVPSAEPQASDVIHVHRATLAAARNAGAELASTEWLCFLDADDELTPGYMDAMARVAADLRGPAVEYVRPGGHAAPPKMWPEVDLADGNYLVIGTLVRRDMFLQVGGFRDWPLYEDWCLWQRCWLAGATVAQVPDAIYRAHVRPTSRNRAPSRDERLHWHHEIRRANLPHLYEAAA
jgi:glycosyltransferase involved in cell wall biosynthesis